MSPAYKVKASPHYTFRAQCWREKTLSKSGCRSPNLVIVTMQD